MMKMHDVIDEAPIRHELAAAASKLTEEHVAETGPLQRATDQVTALVGWPGFVGMLTVAILAWVSSNVLAASFGARPLDAPPFFWLQGAMAAGSLYVAALILTTQRREDKLASHRDQLMLELAILNDKKVSKLIQLLEEARRDDPLMSDRVDEDARAMSAPSDTSAVLDAIKDRRLTPPLSDSAQ